MLQILGTPGYMCNLLQLLLQNSFEGVKLPVRVENGRCNHWLGTVEMYERSGKTGLGHISIYKFVVPFFYCR